MLLFAVSVTVVSVCACSLYVFDCDCDYKCECTVRLCMYVCVAILSLCDDVFLMHAPITQPIFIFSSQPLSLVSMLCIISLVLTDISFAKMRFCFMWCDGQTKTVSGWDKIRKIARINEWLWITIFFRFSLGGRCAALLFSASTLDNKWNIHFYISHAGS